MNLHHHAVAFALLLLALIAACGPADDISGFHPKFCAHTFAFDGVETDLKTMKERTCIKCTQWCAVRHCTEWGTRGFKRRAVGPVNR